MADIRIKHIGPITDTGRLELRTVNLIIGKQSTGKSTLLKILSHCRWVEKLVSLNRHVGTMPPLYAYTHHGRFLREMMTFYRFDENFFSAKSEIEYHGPMVNIRFKGGVKANAKIEAAPGSAPYGTKLCFIPSERNILFAVKDVEGWYRTPQLDLLFNYIFEWDEMKSRYKAGTPMHLTVTPGLEYYCDANGDPTLRMSASGKNFSPFYASSGVQSALPVEVMTGIVAGCVGQSAPASTQDLKKMLYSLLRTDLPERATGELLSYQGVALFIEEIEQNLFPESQGALLRKVIAGIKRAAVMTGGYGKSMLVVTTHSPYILTALNELMAAAEACEIDSEATHAIVPEEAIVPKGEYSAYYLTPEGTAVDIVHDEEIYMVSGVELDGVSDSTETLLDRLNDIICR